MIYSYSVQQEESLYVFQPWGGVTNTTPMNQIINFKLSESK